MVRTYTCKTADLKRRMFVRAKNVTRELTVVQFNTVARRVLICWK